MEVKMDAEAAKEYREMEEKVEQLQAENKQYKDALDIIIEHENDLKKCGIGYDNYVHNVALKVRAGASQGREARPG